MPQSKTTCTFLFYMLTCSFFLSGLYSAPARLVGNSWSPPSLLSVLNRLPLVVHLSLLYKKPQPLLCWLPAFIISPRLPIVCYSPLHLPGFSFPHSREISFSHISGGVPQGWVACHCMFLFNAFLSPIPQKAPKTSPHLPQPWPVFGNLISMISSGVCMCVLGVGGALVFCYPALMVVSLRCRGPCGRLGKKGVPGGHPKTRRTESCFYRAYRTIEGPRNTYIHIHKHTCTCVHTCENEPIYILICT